MKVDQRGLTGTVCRTVDPDGNRSGGAGYCGIVDAGHRGHFIGQRRGFERGAIKRAAHADDMVGAVLWLASSLSDFVTGQTVVVDGGRQFL